MSVRSVRGIWKSMAPLLIHSPRGSGEAPYTYISHCPTALLLLPQPLLMPPPPTPRALKRLRLPDKSSRDFGDQLNNILHGPEYVEWEKKLEGDDLVWFIDYLDKVRRHVTPPHSPPKLVQALDFLDPSCPASRKCLRELRVICGASKTLPTSYGFPSQLLEIDPIPFTHGGSGNVYKGTLDGSKVCIKHIQVYAQDVKQQVKQVRFLYCRFLPLPSLTESRTSAKRP